jgi:hypothetical protein
MDRRGTNKDKVGPEQILWKVRGGRRSGRRKGKLTRKGVVEV